MDWVNPKLDWKPTDFYNAQDLNRVENNSQFITSYLKGLQYPITLVSPMTNRDNTSIDFISSINRLENNIDVIRVGFLTPPNWQNKKTWSVGQEFDYTDANRFESNLNLLYTWALIAKDNLVYCGTFDCGLEYEEGGLYA